MILGQWRIENNKIEVILNANATGKQSISAEFTTGKTAIRSLSPNQGGTFNVSFGGIEKQIAIRTTTFSNLTSGDNKHSKALQVLIWRGSLMLVELR